MWLLAELVNLVTEGWRYRHSKHPEERAKAARSMDCSLAFVIPILLVVGYALFRWLSRTLATDGY